MKWQEIKITVDRCGADAVTDILYDFGAGGVVVEDPLAYKEYVEEKRWDYYELPELKEALTEDQIIVKAYLPHDYRLATRLEEVMLALEVLNTKNLPGCQVDVKLSQVEEEDWANSWKAFYKPEKVGERILIKPSWEDYQAEPKDLVIQLDPGMAFGTGTHATTVMCLRRLEQVIKGGEKVYDVGCGSGVLAIAAAKLGAGEVLAVDLDTTAVNVAQVNVSDNGVAALVEVREGNLLDVAQDPADVVVANIIADIIIQVIPDVARKLKPGGLFISSGIIDDRAEEVLEHLQGAGFESIERDAMGGWVAFTARKAE